MPENVSIILIASLMSIVLAGNVPIEEIFPKTVLLMQIAEAEQMNAWVVDVNEGLPADRVQADPAPAPATEELQTTLLIIKNLSEILNGEPESSIEKISLP